MTLHTVDFPAPCSPLATRIGRGKPGRIAATRKDLNQRPAVVIDIEEGAQLLEAAAALGFWQRLRAARAAKFRRWSIDHPPGAIAQVEVEACLRPRPRAGGLDALRFKQRSRLEQVLRGAGRLTSWALAASTTSLQLSAQVPKPAKSICRPLDFYSTYSMRAGRDSMYKLAPTFGNHRQHRQHRQRSRDRWKGCKPKLRPFRSSLRAS